MANLGRVKDQVLARNQNFVNQSAKSILYHSILGTIISFIYRQLNRRDVNYLQDSTVIVQINTIGNIGFCKQILKDWLRKKCTCICNMILDLQLLIEMYIQYINTCTTMYNGQGGSFDQLLRPQFFFFIILFYKLLNKHFWSHNFKSI
jgi:hypothetical protein